MKKNYFKYLLAAMVIFFIVPNAVLAAWWNPFTWGIFNNIFKKTLPSPLPQPGETAKPEMVVRANNQFAFNLYSKYKSKPENIFFSPFSISSAMAMVYEGSKGETAGQIKSVFHYPDGLIGPDFKKINDEINKKDSKYQLSIANALWAQKSYPFLQSYFSAVYNYYGGNVTNLDFVNETEKSRATINDWVAGKTNQKILNLLPQGTINASTRLVLTDAIYFKGQWVQAFDAKQTIQDAPFTTSENETAKVSMMNRTDKEAKFNYAENDKFQVLQMPYSGNEISMEILLPKNNDLPYLENFLAKGQLSSIEKQLKNQRVIVYIPKFKFSTEYFMADDLKQMGMPVAFSDSADFSGMTGKKDLEISQVIHKAFVEVNEEGTEAAAATAITMEVTSVLGQHEPVIPVFRADHPFIFLIRQNSTGNILFMGKINNPVQ